MGGRTRLWRWALTAILVASLPVAAWAAGGRTLLISSYHPAFQTFFQAMSGDREKFLASGMNGYVPKPVDMHTLLDALDRVFARAEGRSSRGGDT